MKNVMVAYGLVLFLVLSCFVGLTIYGHNSRQNEAEEALAAAAEQALSNLTVEKQYSISSTEEFIADFTQRLVVGIDSNSDIEVNILAVDIEKGLLDVEVIETYRQVNGSTGKASYRKTVIFDEVYAEPVEYCSVHFMRETAAGSGEFELYKEFTITKGANVVFPGAIKDEPNFKGWSRTAPEDGSSEVIDTESVTVDGDMMFYAVFQ